jgi:hypothetical protein
MLLPITLPNFHVVQAWGGSGRIWTKEEWEAEQIIAQRLATLLRACRERHKHLDKLLDDLHLS